MERTEAEKIRELAENQMVDFMRNYQKAQLRLRCVEIIFMSGSNDQRKELDKSAEALYTFALKDIKLS